jgi:two-component system OmpR family response regulator
MVAIGQSGERPVWGAQRSRILIATGDDRLNSDIASIMQGSGHSVTCLRDGKAAARASNAVSFDLLILDCALPGFDSLAFVQKLRMKKMLKPVLAIGKRSSTQDLVQTLSMGCDDYVAKPIDLTALLARVQALLRRTHSETQTILRVGPLEMDLVGRTVKVGGSLVDLLQKEFLLLEYFMRRPGELITQAVLLQHVWNGRFSPHTNCVHVTIGNLRRKLERVSGRLFIENVRGAGFVLRSSGVGSGSSPAPGEFSSMQRELSTN